MDKELRWLIACEESGAVRDALEDLGQNAYSCDLKPTSSKQTKTSGKHIQGDVLKILKEGWDRLIAFPYCTYSTNAGSKWLYINGKKENGIDPERWEELKIGVAFFNAFWNAPIEKKALENPIPHKHALKLMDAKYTQIIQPYMFGHMEQKATCLWLDGFPKLRPTNNVYKEMMRLPYKERCRLHWYSGPDRSEIRSKTFPNIAKAMAKQWSNSKKEGIFF
jgi:hypothetical protein